MLSNVCGMSIEAVSAPARPSRRAPHAIVERGFRDPAGVLLGARGEPTVKVMLGEPRLLGTHTASTPEEKGASAAKHSGSNGSLWLLVCVLIPGKQSATLLAR